MVSMKAGLVVSIVLVRSVFCDETVEIRPAVKFSAVDGEYQTNLHPERQARHLSKYSVPSGGKGEKSEKSKPKSNLSKSKKAGKSGNDRKGEKSRKKGKRSNICDELDFRRRDPVAITGNVFSDAIGNDRTPPGKPRQTLRRLQLDGEGCSPIGLETARNNTHLSTFLDLLEFAGLEHLLSCPVSKAKCRVRSNTHTGRYLGSFHNSGTIKHSV
jgi:hypothetical protein